MYDHVAVGVSDLARSIVFYDAVLETLGYKRVWTFEDAAGYRGVDRDGLFALNQAAPANAVSSLRSHIAFAASGRSAVEAFYAAAIAHGAADDGAPDFCSEYGPGYFAAFVFDPDGYRIEAVCDIGVDQRPSSFARRQRYRRDPGRRTNAEKRTQHGHMRRCSSSELPPESDSTLPIGKAGTTVLTGSMYALENR